MKYLFDTDHLVIIQRQLQPGWSCLREHLTGLPSTDVCLCSISFHEQLLGSNAFISQAKSRDQLVRGYRMLERSLADASNFVVLAFDNDSAEVFEDLRRQGIRIGTMDLRIASIALRHRLTVLTRNRVDFEQVPNLSVADWTRP